MAFRLEHSEPIGVGVQRVTAERLDDGMLRLERLATAGPSEVEKTVHEVRKRCKELRGLLRLVRPALGATCATPRGATVATAPSSIRSSGLRPTRPPPRPRP